MLRLIDANAFYESYCTTYENNVPDAEMDRMSHAIAAQPTIEAEPIHYGWWRETEDGDWECTSCKNTVTICVCGKDRTSCMTRCPHCGARMGGGQRE